MRQPLAKLLLLATSVAACAGRGSTASSSPSAGIYPPDYSRVVYGIEVRDTAGVLFTHPFLGGFNVPRAQLIDIDGDGDLDLFLQEASDRLKFFENVGTPQAAHFLWRTDAYDNLQVGEWYRFVDLDGDGDYDLLSEEPFSHIRYYRNDGSVTQSRFTLAVDTLKDVDGVPIFSDRQNIPNVTDIDCDELPDLFIGRLVGTVTRYESVGVDDNGVPRFRHVEDDFEDIEIIAQFGSRHGANTMAFSDIDGDGDQDFFWGDFFEPGLLFIENTGSCSRPILRNEPTAFPLSAPLSTSGYNAPTFGDIDGDGDLDLFVGVLGGAYNPNRTSADNFYFLEQTAPGTFEERSRRFLNGVDVGNESIPVFIDLDDDGDLDLLLANKIDQSNSRTSYIYRFDNVGSATDPSFRAVGRLELPNNYHYHPAFGDLDGDGDADIVLGSWNDEVAYYRNDGTSASPNFVMETDELLKITRGSNTTPALVDIDADGDLDLFIGEASGTINYYRNDGTASEPAFTLVSDRYLEIDVGRRSFPAFVDLDRDGDYDMVIGNERGDLLVYLNQGTASEPNFVEDMPIPVDVPAYSAPAFVDIDADGDIDLFVGGLGGGLFFYERR